MGRCLKRTRRETSCMDSDELLSFQSHRSSSRKYMDLHNLKSAWQHRHHHIFRHTPLRGTLLTVVGLIRAIRVQIKWVDKRAEESPTPCRLAARLAGHGGSTSDRCQRGPCDGETGAPTCMGGPPSRNGTEVSDGQPRGVPSIAR